MNKKMSTYEMDLELNRALNVFYDVNSNNKAYICGFLMSLLTRACFGNKKITEEILTTLNA